MASAVAVACIQATTQEWIDSSDGLRRNQGSKWNLFLESKIKKLSLVFELYTCIYGSLQRYVPFHFEAASQNKHRNAQNAPLSTKQSATATVTASWSDSKNANILIEHCFYNRLSAANRSLTATTTIIPSWLWILLQLECNTVQLAMICSHLYLLSSAVPASLSPSTATVDLCRWSLRLRWQRPADSTGARSASS